VATNRATDINLLPLEAIQRLPCQFCSIHILTAGNPRARKFDEEVVASIISATKTCILRNPNNDESARMGKNVGRQANRTRKRREHNKLDDGIDMVKEKLASTAQEQKDLKARLKDLQVQKKEAGRTPRHNRPSTSQFDDVHIPKIVGLEPLHTQPLIGALTHSLS